MHVLRSLYVLDNANTNFTVYRLSPSKFPPVRGEVSAL